VTRSERVWLWLLVMAAFVDMGDRHVGTWHAALDYSLAAVFGFRAIYFAIWPLKKMAAAA